MHGLETGLLLQGGEPTVVVEATAEAEITAATAEVEFVIDIATETVVGPTTVDPLVDVVARIPGTFFCACYALRKHWLANNILGLAFCI